MKLVVLTVPERSTNGRALAEDLDARLHVDMFNDPTRAHAEAWKLGLLEAESDDEWVGVIEDDAIPAWWVGGSHEAIENMNTPRWVGGSYDDTQYEETPRWGLIDEMLSNAPSPIVSGYLGKGRPKSMQGWAEAGTQKDVAWLLCHRLLHHVAVFMKASLVAQAVDQAFRFPNVPCDEALSVWAQGRGYPVAYSNPSMFDHLDAEPVVSPSQRRLTDPDPVARIAWTLGVRESYPADSFAWLDPISERMYGSRFEQKQGSLR